MVRFLAFPMTPTLSIRERKENEENKIGRKRKREQGEKKITRKVRENQDNKT